MKVHGFVNWNWAIHAGWPNKRTIFTGWGWWSEKCVGLTWISMFYHPAQLPSRFCQVSICHSRTGQTVEFQKQSVSDHQPHPVLQWHILSLLCSIVKSKFHLTCREKRERELAAQKLRRETKRREKRKEVCTLLNFYYTLDQLTVYLCIHLNHL